MGIPMWLLLAVSAGERQWCERGWLAGRMGSPWGSVPRAFPSVEAELAFAEGFEAGQLAAWAN
jgi:hypothetical protein